MFHRVVLPLEAGFPHLTLLGYLTLSIVSPLALSSQTINSWTNTGSGNWEDLRWSLGQRPASGQSIMLTNSGWKAVAIGSGTVQNFPQTLNPSSITLGAYTDSFNVLLLNFAGFQTPLSVSQLIINSNSAVTALSSALTVNNGMGGAFSIGGAFNHGDFSVVSAANLNIGDIGPGTYNLTNGTLLVTATQTIAGASSRVNQFGGTNYPANLALSPGGEYDIVGGSVAASNLIYRSGGNFRQQGGVVRADKAYLNLGAYYLSAGSFSSGDVEVPGTQSNYDYAGGASFIQTGGSNNTVYLSIGNWRPPLINASSSGDYNLSTGILVTATTSLGPYGGFVQSGGTHNAGAVGMFGDIVYYFEPASAHYSLDGGMLFAGSLGMKIATFSQTGGTNQISGDLTLYPYVTWGSWSDYHLSGGLLVTSNTFVSASWDGGFYQSGGTHVVSNLLTVSQSSANFAGYVLSAGQLIASNIQVDTGGAFHHSGGTLINTGMITLANGIWTANTNDQPFGRFLLGQGSNSTILLPSASSILRFAQSSSILWSNQAILTVEHWSGSLSGSGPHQIYFGNSTAGLSSQQLAQIRFHNPLGENGTYPATILPSGEIVPAQFLASGVTGDGLQLSWAPGMILQSSTNIAGPYQDVPEASNPYAVISSDPQRFFRLRH